MQIQRFLRERMVAETRWAAVDKEGRALALYLERPDQPLTLGQRFQARIGGQDAAAGGVFVRFAGHGEAFLRTRGHSRANAGTLAAAPEGAEVTVEIAAEAHAGKLPRVRLVDPATPPAPAGAEAWRAMLRNGAAAPVEDVAPGDSLIAAAFEDALLAPVTLPGGGTISIEQTRALTAVDIDTAGRAGRGSAAARALAINEDAAGTLAREILLRGLGGLFVLDCVAPLNAGSGARVRTAFLQAWDGLSVQPVRALAPSPLGLMEISTSWSVTPLAERLLDAAGKMTPASIACAGLRLLEIEARQDRMGRLTLALPEAAYQWLAASGIGAEARLAERYGARLKIRGHASAEAAVLREA